MRSMKKFRSYSFPPRARAASDQTKKAGMRTAAASETRRTKPLPTWRRFLDGLVLEYHARAVKEIAAAPT